MSLFMRRHIALFGCALLASYTASWLCVFSVPYSANEMLIRHRPICYIIDDEVMPGWHANGVLGSWYDWGYKDLGIKVSDWPDFEREADQYDAEASGIVYHVRLLNGDPCLSLKVGIPFRSLTVTAEERSKYPEWRFFETDWKIVTLNGIIWYVILAVLMHFVRYTRYAMTRRKDHCVNCNYAVLELPLCPECGHIKRA